MILFISQLTEDGKPLPVRIICSVCHKTYRTEKGYNIHKAVHRDGSVTSYHDKENLYKSEKHTGGDKKRTVDYTPHEPDMRFIQ